MLRQCKLYACPNGTLGLHLSRAPWDPYPWVSGIQDGSSAERAGVLSGDTVLEMNGCDVLGQKISHIAEHIGAHWKSGASYVTVLIWRNQPDGVTSCEDDSSDGKPQSEMAGKQNQQHQSINQQSLQKFATCLQHIAQLLECPVCLEVTRPPGWQCCNGHVLCNNCRSRSVKCPVCRVPLGQRGRCLMSDKLFTLLAESFPCNGVRHNDGNKSNNNNSPEEIKEYTQGFQNYPKSKDKEKKLIKSTKHVLDHVKYEETFKQQGRRSKSVVDVDAAKDENVARVEEHQQQQEDDMRQLQANHIQYNADNMARICLRRTGETSKVHQLNELEFIKSHKEKFLQNSVTEKLNATCRKETLSSRSNMECNGCEKSLVAVVGANTQFGTARNVQNRSIPVRRCKSKRTDSDNSSNNNKNNNNNTDDHVIIKLNLKSNAKFAECLMDNSSNSNNNNHTKVIAVNKDADKKDEDVDNKNSKTLRKSHETRVEDKVAREVNRRTTRQMAVQRQQKIQQQQQQQQQCQNYYCPTGKSCCCYVQSSTRATTTTAISAAGRAAAAPLPMNKCFSTSSETSSTNNNKDEYVAVAKIAKKEKSEDQQRVEEVTTKLSTQVAAVAIDVASTTADSNVWSATTAQLAHSNCNQRLTKMRTTTTTTTTTKTEMTISLSRDWQVFAHLTEVHHVAVAHYYGAFGTRIRVNFMHSKSMPCIHVWQGRHGRQQDDYTTEQPQRHANINNNSNKNQMQQFFVARIPLTAQVAPHDDDGATQEIVKEQLTSNTASKYAIFLWYLNLTDDVVDVDVDVENCNYDTIIESRRTGVRWFGAAHALSKTSWPQIHAEGHFMLHTARTAAAQQVIALWPGWQQPAVFNGDGDNDDFFDIVIKIK